MDYDDEGEPLPNRHRLTPGTLARFAGGLTWRGILDLTNGAQRGWWRSAVADSEERGLLEWDRAAKIWRLTEDGKALVKDIS